MNQTSSSRPTLVRGLGAYMAIAVVVGTVIGSGVFVKPQAIATELPSPDWVAMVWILGGVLTLLGALALAEVAVLYPRAGGNYVFLREGYGRWAAFLWGWVEFLIIRTASMAALATMFTLSFRDILKETTGHSDPLTFWGERTLTIAVIILIAAINIRGVRWGGALQLAVTVVKIATLIGIMLLPWLFLALSREIPSAGTPTAAQMESVPATLTMENFLLAVLAVLWPYHGWMSIAPVAGEIRQPSRNIPLALLVGVGLVIVLYLGVNFAYHEVLPMWEMASMKSNPYLKDMPVATLFTTRLLGTIGTLVVSAAIMISVFGALNGNLLAAPRLLYAMGEDRLAPQALGAIHPRYHTPMLAIVVSAAWTVLLVLAVAMLTWFEFIHPKRSAFDVLTDFAMFGAVSFETLAVTTIFIFRWRLPHAERPYRCPAYPVVPILYMILPALVLGNMFIYRPLEALAGTGFILLGAVVYLIICQRTKLLTQR
jgi:basic amino acid/polyamine antiporter, APA family